MARTLWGGVVEVDVARGKSRVGSVDPLSVGMSLDGTGATNVSLTGGHLISDTDHQWVFRGGGGFTDRRGFPVSDQALDDPTLRSQFLSADALRLNSDQRRIDGFFSAPVPATTMVHGLRSRPSGYDVERGVPPEAHQDDPRLWRYPEQRPNDRGSDRRHRAASDGAGVKVTSRPAWASMSDPRSSSSSRPSTTT